MTPTVLSTDLPVGISAIPLPMQASHQPTNKARLLNILANRKPHNPIANRKTGNQPRKKKILYRQENKMLPSFRSDKKPSIHPKHASNLPPTLADDPSSDFPSTHSCSQLPFHPILHTSDHPTLSPYPLSFKRFSKLSISLSIFTHSI